MLINALSIYPDRVQWVQSEEKDVISSILNGFNIPYYLRRFDIKTKYRYLATRYQFNRPAKYFVPITPWQKYYLDYYHGGYYGEKFYEDNIKRIVKHQNSIKGIRVTCEFYYKLLIKKGIDPSKLFKIPLLVNQDIYYPRNINEKNNIKRKLNIKEDRHLIGSFQKDGIGWSEGMEPKLIKGPDIFIDTINILNKEIKNLTIILTGPSRGYIKSRLKELSIDFRHFDANNTEYRSQLYNILDGYIVSSREEGGPKGFLEAIACGIPVVTTNVGQIRDIGTHKEDCYIINTFSHSDLARAYIEMLKIKEDSGFKSKLLKKATKYSTGSDLHLWEQFFSI